MDTQTGNQNHDKQYLDDQHLIDNPWQEILGEDDWRPHNIPHEKYRGGNYAQIARNLYEYADNGLANVQQFARRLLVNILLANGDAHLKNWSVIYPDIMTPTLSPAYDIVFTQAYILGEKSFALNLAKTKMR